MNSEPPISRRQLYAACTIFFLAPALRLVPSASARLAGRAAWLSVPMALPLLLLYIWFLHAFYSRRLDGEGLGELTQRALGARWGRGALILLGGWFILYAGFMLRSGADRIINTMYPNSTPELFIVTMGALALIGALDSARTLVRAACLFLSAVLGVLFIVLIFALFSIDGANLLPMTLPRMTDAAVASLATLDVAVMPAYTALFLSSVRAEGRGGLREGFLWGVGIIALLFWLITDITGVFGAELSSRLTHPFFSLVKNLVFFRTIERAEALVVSLWVLSDFVVIALCLMTAQRCLRLAFGFSARYQGEARLDMRHGRWLIWLCAGGCVALALFIARDARALDTWSRRIIPLINLAVAFILLPIIYIVGRARKAL